MFDPTTLLLLVPSILLGLTLHELAHGLVADRLGDPTPRNQGRLTLNPIKHLDLIGTIMLFVVHFGWAKPVQVNPRNFQNVKRDMLLVALAGPLTNLVLAALLGLILRGIEPDPQGTMLIVEQMLYVGVLINVSLGIFNLLPIPPLDGSRILHAVWPNRYEHQYRLFEKYGGIVLLAIILFGMFSGVSIIWAVLGPATDFFMTLFAGQ